MTESNNPLEYEIREAFRSVSVPAALKQRVRERIRMEASLGGSIAQASVAEISESPIADVAKRTIRAEEPGVTKRGLSRRFWIAAVGVSAASIAGGILAFPSAPLSRHDVAVRSINLAVALEEGAADDAWDLDPQWPKLLKKQLNVQGTLRGYASIPDEYFANGGGNCEVWKVDLNPQTDFYVVHIPKISITTQISGIMQKIPSSGGWQVAAMRSGKGLLLVIYKGDEVPSLDPGQFA